MCNGNCTFGDGGGDTSGVFQIWIMKIVDVLLPKLAGRLNSQVNDNKAM